MNTNTTPDIKPLYDQFSAHYHAGETERALEVIQHIIQLQPDNAFMWSNAASVANRAQNYDLSIQYALHSLQLNPNMINSYDCLSHAYYLTQDDVRAGQYGLRALQLRDEKAQAAAPHFRLPETPLRTSGQQIIAFSLFGDSPKYAEGALMNALLAPDIYPDWVCRFYVNHTVPEWTKQKLREYGAQVVEVSGEAAQWVGTVWRFLALDDETVARVIFRDVDSIISLREVQTVQEWVQSGKRFHTIRDGGSHTELVLAGLWGAIGGAIDDMQGKLRQYFSQPLISSHFADQFFLREHIWKYIRQDVLAHDRLFGFMNAVPMPAVPADLDLRKYHVGSCQMISMDINCPFPEGAMMQFTAESRLLPMHNPDFTWRRLPEKRLLSQYQLPVKHGKITVWMPRAYQDGLATKDTSIQITTSAKPINA